MGLTRPRAAQIFNLDYKQSTRVVTTANITLTGGAPSQVDGVNLSANDRILVTAQTTASQNGLYYVVTLGSGSSGTWARTTDGNENGEIEAGMIVMVTEGVIYADTQWKLITDDPIVIGTTALTFTQNYLANSVSSGTSNVVVSSNANVTISSAGTPNVLVISSTGTVVSGTLSVTGNITGNYIFGNGSQLTGIAGGSTYSNANVTTLLANFGSNTISTTGNVTAGYFLGNGSQLTGLPATYGNSNVATLLASFGSNSISTTGNVTAANLNSSNADLAEMYSADAEYAPGTVVDFGGVNEITISTASHSTRVAGIISTNPSYLMNSTLEGEHALELALTGRVPCQVVGTIRKGDRLVTSGLYPGVATALDSEQYQPGCIIGKALEDYQSTEVGVIEVAVGRF
jgi:hypothetical protein